MDALHQLHAALLRMLLADADRGSRCIGREGSVSQAVRQYQPGSPGLWRFRKAPGVAADRFTGHGKGNSADLGTCPL